MSLSRTSTAKSNNSHASSISNVTIATKSKVKWDDLSPNWTTALKAATKQLKEQNPDIKKMTVKGGPHQSSTVRTHRNIVSVTLHNIFGIYLGSTHVDEDGTPYPNEAFNAKVAHRKSQQEKKK